MLRPAFLPPTFLSLRRTPPFRRINPLRATRHPFSTCMSASPPPDAGITSIISAARFESAFAELDPSQPPIPVDLVPKSKWPDYLKSHDEHTQAWLSAHGSVPSTATPIPSFEPSGAPFRRIAVPIKPGTQPLWTLAAAVASLPKGHSYVLDKTGGFDPATIELAWGLTSYAYTTYKKPEDDKYSTLVRSTKHASEDRAGVDRAIRATYMVRDMISTPAEHFGPANMEAAVSTLAAQHAARSSSIVGAQLLRLGYPQVHTVGRASTADRAPRLLELVWNEGAEKKVTLVGKGVCYDTGGLSIKPTSSMLTMKKDMGGAAQVLGLAHMIMDSGLDVRLRVLIPAVENCVAGSSYRPGDVLTARNGTTTLNMNSDAEGRLVLADALVAATEDEPDLIVDCATLTGAQRVALGTDVPSYFCDDEEVSAKLAQISRRVDDLMWRLPLHAPYRKLLDTPIADIKSCSSGSFGGAITAALYLKEFVGDSLWIHVDMMGYNTTSSPGRPEGGEAMGMRALFEFLRELYGAS